MMQGFNMRDQAFTDTTDALLPLTADQIRTLHTLFSQTQRAVGEVPGIPPRPTSTSKIVNLSPGATPPIIRLAAGFVTSLVFLDSAGTAWPVEAYDLGDPRSFNIQWDKKSNTLLVQAITEYKTGNLAVLLRGLNTPVMLTLLPGQRAVDYRVDLRIPGLGPNAVPTMTTIESLPGASNPILLDVLNGIPPAGAKTLQIMGRDCQVWLLNGKMYLRTRTTILSPAWLSTLSSADGMHAYEMAPTPVILASENGKMVKMTIQGL
jgi:intracellular multiplication protein IcmK